MVIVRICVLHRIIIIKSEVWIICNLSLFRFRSWNNGVRYISFYTLIAIIHLYACVNNDAINNTIMIQLSILRIVQLFPRRCLDTMLHTVPLINE